jgi:hypothetical protein
VASVTICCGACFCRTGIDNEADRAACDAPPTVILLSTTSLGDYERSPMRLRTFILATLLALPVASLGADNERLRAIVQADQADRQGSATTAQWKEISKRDAARRSQLHAELVAGRIRSAADFYHAGLVMQHGDTLEDIRLAHSFATIASVLDPLDRSARWLKAASWDRMLMRQKKPQWYGTQYVTDSKGKVVLYTIDENAVTDADRIELAAPTLAEARKKAASFGSAR